MSFNHFSDTRTSMLFSHPESYYLLDSGEKALMRGKFDTAFKLFKRLNDHYGTHYEPGFTSLKCSIAAAKKGDHQTAQMYFMQSFKVNPSEEKLKYSRLGMQ